SIFHAFIWSNGTMSDVNGQLDSTGTGWTLIEARAINDAGQITGIGSLGGVSHAFLLKPASIVDVQPPQISSIQRVGSDVVISFTTVAGETYTVQMKDSLQTNGWTNLSSSVTGTGAIISVTDSGGAAFSTRFYRVRAAL